MAPMAAEVAYAKHAALSAGAKSRATRCASASLRGVIGVQNWTPIRGHSTPIDRRGVGGRREQAGFAPLLPAMSAFDLLTGRELAAGVGVFLTSPLSIA
jgi:hypothetical protein